MRTQQPSFEFTVPKLGNTNVVSGHLDPASSDEIIISGVTISGATAGRGGGFNNSTTIATLTDCAFYNNVGTVNTNGIYIGGGTVTLINCTFGSGQNIRVQAGELICSGTITTLSAIGVPLETYVRVKAGTILDLKNNTTSTGVIGAQTTGHIVVEGTCQIVTSTGTTVSISGGAYTKINNDGTTE